MSTATYFGPSFKPQTAAKPSKAQEARSGVQHAMPSRPEHYAHWGVLHRLHSLRYHKYHCGIHEQIIGFFANVADGPTETYDLTGCTVLVGFTQRRNEFVVRRPKEDGAAKESLWVLRCGSEVEVEAWAAAITKVHCSQGPASNVRSRVPVPFVVVLGGSRKRTARAQEYHEAASKITGKKREENIRETARKYQEKHPANTWGTTGHSQENNSAVQNSSRASKGQYF